MSKKIKMPAKMKTDNKNLSRGQRDSISRGSLQERKYKCKWCQYEFKQMVGTANRDKKNRASSQVPCPECGNFQKTWQV